MATIEDFQKLDIRVGKILEVTDFPEAKKPAYKREELVGRLVLRVPYKDGKVILIRPDW